jgi:Fe-S-cluster containining protein
MRNPILDAYGRLLTEVDRWFADCLRQFPGDIRCGQGCSGCCRALFDITLLDAWQLKTGFDQLPAPAKEAPLARAGTRAAELARLWPGFSAPFILNLRPDSEWEELMPEDDETPCPLLADDGRCLVYDHRPMTCRLHGLPLVDVNGEVLHDEWCTENFATRDPLALAALQGPFIALFREEVRLGRLFTAELLGAPLGELDTFIPTALLLDFASFDWRGWWSDNGEQVRQTARIQGGPEE